MSSYHEQPTRKPRYVKQRSRPNSMGTLNHKEILKNFAIQYGLPEPQIIIYPDLHSQSSSLFMAHVNFKDHLIIQTDSTKELAENKAALNLLELLMKNYDLCDDNNTETYKGKVKTKDQEIQTDPRPKLVASENSYKYCNTQAHNIAYCHRKIIKRQKDKVTRFPPTLPFRIPNTFAQLFKPFSSKTPTILQFTCINRFLTTNAILSSRNSLPNLPFIKIIKCLNFKQNRTQLLTLQIL